MAISFSEVSCRLKAISKNRLKRSFGQASQPSPNPKSPKIELF